LMGLFTALWSFVLRFSVGGFWLFFASQRWFDRSWVEGLFTTAAAANYLPVYGDVLRRAAESWMYVALATTAAETVVGLMMVLGVFTRAAGTAGAFIALNLWLTFSFCDCWWNRQDAPQVFWFYFSALLLNLAVAREKTHPPLIRRRNSKKPV